MALPIATLNERYAMLTATPPEQLKLLTLQLGSGCSATAIAAGRSVDTSRGVKPLEGLMMGTRAGDIDPALPGFLPRKEGIEPGEAEAQGEARAALAVDMFCSRVRKYLAAYLGVLNGAAAIVFGGGIGENAPAVRERICDQMSWCGLQLDPPRNAAARGTEAQISADNAKLHAYVIPVDEAVIIARDTAACLGIYATHK